jgi:hypothetical protein
MVVSFFRGGLVAKRSRSLRPAKTSIHYYLADARIFCVFEYLNSSEARKLGINNAQPLGISDCRLSPGSAFSSSEKRKNQNGMLPVTDTMPLPLTLSRLFLI